ncbi:ankyrin repeat-containing domain protein [Globomyces pollinis-pini]|nr:ankyrin repeat-containing domain protein [Globomyces pollinis-pini]
MKLSQASINDIPSEIFSIISSYLSHTDYTSLRLSSKSITFESNPRMSFEAYKQSITENPKIEDASPDCPDGAKILINISLVTDKSFIYLAQNNRTKELLRCLKSNIVLSTESLQSAFNWIIKSPNADQVVHFMVQNRNVNPSISQNFAIKLSAQIGNFKVLKTLLKDSRVNAGDDDNFAIQAASANGHTSIVELLLQDINVDPSSVNNKAIRHAAENGHVDVVKILISDPRTNPNALNQYAIRLAAANGHTDVVKFLLNDSRVDPSVLNNEAIRKAAENGHLKIVELLLADARTNPSTGTIDALQTALSQNRVDVVYLISNSVKYCRTKCLKCLITFGYIDMFKQIAESSVLEIKENCKDLRNLAIENSHLELLSFMDFLLARVK